MADHVGIAPCGLREEQVLRADHAVKILAADVAVTRASLSSPSASASPDLKRQEDAQTGAARSSTSSTGSTSSQQTHSTQHNVPKRAFPVLQIHQSKTVPTSALGSPRGAGGSGFVPANRGSSNHQQPNPRCSTPPRRKSNFMSPIGNFRQRSPRGLSSRGTINMPSPPPATLIPGASAGVPLADAAVEKENVEPLTSARRGVSLGTSHRRNPFRQAVVEKNATGAGNGNRSSRPTLEPTRSTGSNTAAQDAAEGGGGGKSFTGSPAGASKDGVAGDIAGSGASGKSGQREQSRRRSRHVVSAKTSARATASSCRANHVAEPSVIAVASPSPSASASPNQKTSSGSAEQKSSCRTAAALSATTAAGGGGAAASSADNARRSTTGQQRPALQPWLQVPSGGRPLITTPAGAGGGSRAQLPGMKRPEWDNKLDFKTKTVLSGGGPTTRPSAWEVSGLEAWKKKLAAASSPVVQQQASTARATSSSTAGHAGAGVNEGTTTTIAVDGEQDAGAGAVSASPSGSTSAAATSTTSKGAGGGASATPGGANSPTAPAATLVAVGAPATSGNTPASLAARNNFSPRGARLAVEPLQAPKLLQTTAFQPLTTSATSRPPGALLRQTLLTANAFVQPQLSASNQVANAGKQFQLLPRKAATPTTAVLLNKPMMAGNVDVQNQQMVLEEKNKGDAASAHVGDEDPAREESAAPSAAGRDSRAASSQATVRMSNSAAEHENTTKTSSTSKIAAGKLGTTSSGVVLPSAIDAATAYLAQDESRGNPGHKAVRAAKDAFAALPKGGDKVASSGAGAAPTVGGLGDRFKAKAYQAREIRNSQSSPHVRGEPASTSHEGAQGPAASSGEAAPRGRTSTVSTASAAAAAASSPTTQSAMPIATILPSRTTSSRPSTTTLKPTASSIGNGHHAVAASHHQLTTSTTASSPPIKSAATTSTAAQSPPAPSVPTTAITVPPYRGRRMKCFGKYQPAARVYAGSAVVDNRTFWLYGGTVDTNAGVTPFEDLWELNLHTQQWTQHKHPPGTTPGPLCKHSLLAWKHFLVLFGGWNGTRRCNALWFYDTKSHVWQEVVDKNASSLTTSSATQLNSFGQQNKAARTTYHQDDSTWPPPHTSHAVTLVDQDIMVVIGRGETGSHRKYGSDIDFFDCHNRVWILGGARFDARAGHSLTALANGQVLMYGGRKDNCVKFFKYPDYCPHPDAVTQAGFLQPSPDARAGVQLEVPGMAGPVHPPFGRSFHGMVTLRPAHLHLLHGGFLESSTVTGRCLFDATRQICVYDEVRESWFELAPDGGKADHSTMFFKANSPNDAQLSEQQENVLEYLDSVQLLPPRAGHSLHVIPHPSEERRIRVVLFGGTHAGVNFDDVWFLDLDIAAVKAGEAGADAKAAAQLFDGKSHYLLKAKSMDPGSFSAALREQKREEKARNALLRKEEVNRERMSRNAERDKKSLEMREQQGYVIHPSPPPRSKSPARVSGAGAGSSTTTNYMGSAGVSSSAGGGTFGFRPAART